MIFPRQDGKVDEVVKIDRVAVVLAILGIKFWVVRVSFEIG